MRCRDATLGPLPAAFTTSLLLLMPAYQSIDSTTRCCLLHTPCDHSNERYLLLNPFTIGCRDVTLGLLPDAESRQSVDTSPCRAQYRWFSEGLSNLAYVTTKHPDYNSATALHPNVQCTTCIVGVGSSTSTECAVDCL